jgi:hypothetical protein
MAWLPLRVIPLLALGLCLGIGPAALAKEAKQTICCRSSGGTRGTCLNLWAHMVPQSNRFKSLRKNRLRRRVFPS